MADQNFKEVYNIKYFFGFILALGIPTLPLTLSLVKIFG